MNFCLQTLAPSPPILYLLNSTATSVHLRWAAPASLNGILQYYLIIYHESDLPQKHGILIEVPPTQLSYTITGLRENTSYSVRVAATTSVEGEFGNILSVTTTIFSKCLKWFCVQ